MRWLIVALVVAVSASPAGAQAIRPAILFEVRNIDVDGFTRSALDGARAFTKQSGIDVDVLTPDAGAAPTVDTATRLARRALEDGHDTLVGVGYLYEEAFRELAPRYPHARFVVLDSELDRENVVSVSFRDDEGSLLVGAMAAMATETGIIGFVGGMDIALIRRFACGYVLGARIVDPDVRVRVEMVGTTPAAWNDPVRGAALAEALIADGADVVYHAAGASGLGVIEAVADAGKLAIGVDSNQNALAPGHVLTSMLKRLDVAVFVTLTEIANGRWTPGPCRLGLVDGGVDWALDEHNIGLVSEAMHARIDDIAFDVLSGRIAVARYTKEGDCPGYDFGPLPPAP